MSSRPSRNRSSALLSILFGWLFLAGLVSPPLHGSIPRDRHPTVELLALIEGPPAAERVASAFPTARLELGISDEDSAILRRVLVRQNPWSSFDPDGLARQLIGWVYDIRNAELGNYVGKAVQTATRWTPSHEHLSILKHPATEFHLSPVYGTAPKGGWTAGALDKALRAEEELVLRAGEKAGVLFKNGIRAASAENQSKWKTEYDTARGRSVKARGIQAALDASAERGPLVKRSNGTGGFVGIEALALMVNASVLICLDAQLAKQLDVTSGEVAKTQRWAEAIEKFYQLRQNSTFEHINGVRLVGGTNPSWVGYNTHSDSWESHAAVALRTSMFVIRYDPETGGFEDMTWHKNNAVREFKDKKR